MGLSVRWECKSVAGLLLGALLLPASLPAAVPTGHAMVVTIHHDASDAGLLILKQGGNAVDAAVAVGFALAVVLPQAGNLGGGGFMLIRMNPAGPEARVGGASGTAGSAAGGAGTHGRAGRYGNAIRTPSARPQLNVEQAGEGKTLGRDTLGSGKAGGSNGAGGDEAHFLDFRERAPGAATAEMYLDAQGKVVPDLSTLGYKAIGVPGSVAGLAYAQKHFGRLTLAQDMAPAIRLATEGYVLSAEEAKTFHASNLNGFPESRRIFQRGGRFYAAGETFRQPELAQTLTRLAANPDEFYHGKMAQELARSVQTHGGLLSEADLAGYAVVDRKPLVGQFRAHGAEYDVITSPPPSSGGIALIETLNMLSGYDLPKLGGDRSAAQVHVIAEAFRRAYMDRADYLGDPDYSAIPVAEMASMKYAAAWRASIDATKPTPSSELRRPAGFLPAPPASVAKAKESTQTTHYSVVDAEGNAVSTTYTLNGLFGSGVTAEGLGFLLNNEMDDFSSKPGTPNMFGLIQGPANAIGPGHRPLSSMTPTIVTTHAEAGRPGKLVLVLGSPGGATIITTVANDLLSVLVNGLSVQAAADAPRFHHQYLPDVLDFEKSFPVATVGALKGMGYTVSRANEADEGIAGVWGDSELIGVDVGTGKLEGGQDKRHGFGKVAAY